MVQKTKTARFKTDKMIQICVDSQQKKQEFTVTTQIRNFCKSYDGREKFRIIYHIFGPRTVITRFVWPILQTFVR